MHGIAPGHLQGVELQGKGLAFGRDAGIADLFHGGILRVPFRAIQPFLVQSLQESGSAVRAHRPKRDDINRLLAPPAFFRGNVFQHVMELKAEGIGDAQADNQGWRTFPLLDLPYHRPIYTGESAQPLQGKTLAGFFVRAAVAAAS